MKTYVWVLIKSAREEVRKKSGPSRSIVTMLLVNVSLKIWSLNMLYKVIFLLFFQQKYLQIRYFIK